MATFKLPDSYHCLDWKPWGDCSPRKRLRQTPGKMPQILRSFKNLCECDISGSVSIPAQTGPAL